MYMRRWCLNLFGFSARVHRFHKSDDLFHDHPFWFVAMAIWGTGTELMGVPNAHWERRIRLFQPRFYSAKASHCVTACEGLWTLVLAGRYRKPWGFFLKDKGWVHWREIDKWNTYEGGDDG